MNIEQLEARIVELQNTARQQEVSLIQISGAIQELTTMVNKLKDNQDAAETRNE
jgi:uncharacterized coiled-coil protein SlyX